MITARSTIIYALLNPKTLAVRYVGKTCNRLERRVIQHVNAARAGKNTYLCRWLRVIAEKPIAVVIQVVPPGGNWAAAERRWIRRCREHGCRLTNLTDGGEGICGLQYSKERREKIAAAKRTGTMVACDQCGKNCWRKKSDLVMPHHFCSRKCYTEWQTGRTKPMPPMVMTEARLAVFEARRRRDICREGHPLIGGNVYVNRKGSRICKICRRNYKRAWRLSHVG